MGAAQTKVIQESVAQLQQASISPANEEFWKRFWTSPATAAELDALIPTKELIKIRNISPRNFATLIIQLIARIKRALSSRNTANDLKEVMNCVRLLTRLLPVAFEASQSQVFEPTLFWKNTLPGSDAAASDVNAAPSESEDPIVPPASGSTDINTFQKAFDAVLKSERPVARQLLDSLLSLSFFPGLTTVAFTESQEERSKLTEIPIKYGWAPGVGIPLTAPNNSAGYLDANRYEILLCLLASISSSIYTPLATADLTQGKNAWLDELVTRKRTSTRLWLYSMLNVVLRYDPVGWGVPYNHALFQDIPEQLMNVSVQILSLLLEYRSPEGAVAVTAAAPQPTVVAASVPYFSASNLFAIGLSEISSQQEFELIFKAVVRLLTNRITAASTYLPGATKQISCHQEVLSFFWQFIQINRKFLDFILKRDDFVDVLFPVLYFIHEGRKDPAQLGLVHLGTFLLLFLSGEREFSIALNRPIAKKILVDIPKFTGNYADYLILVFIKLFVDGHKRLESLWECMLTVVANASPYLKSLSLVTSMRLLKLFGTLSRKNFLLQRDRNHRYIFFLLESFNNILQYQYEGNTFLVYAIISHRSFFFKLLELAKNPASAIGEPNNAETSAARTHSPTALEKTETAEVASSSSSKDQHTASPVNSSNAEEPHFVPTIEWLGTWVPRLPLGTIIRFLNGMLPTVDSLVDGTASDQDKIVEYLRKATLVGILPVPHPILIRHYAANKQTQTWFNQFLWGVTFLRNSIQPKVFADTKPQLFVLRSPGDDLAK